MMTRTWFLILFAPSMAACAASEKAGPMRPDGGETVSLDAGYELRLPDNDDAPGAPAHADVALDAVLSDAGVDGGAQAAWWSPMFSRRRRLTVDARLASSASTLSDFPVALRIP